MQNRANPGGPLVFSIFGHFWGPIEGQFCLGLYQNRLDLYQNRLDLYQNRLDLYQNRLDLYQNRLELYQNRLDLYQKHTKLYQICMGSKANRSGWGVISIDLPN